MKKSLFALVLALAVFFGLFLSLSVLGGNLSDEETIWNARRAEVLDAGGATAIGNLFPGVFMGTGAGGFYGSVSVEITVDPSGRIVDVEVVYSSETPSFAHPAFEHLTASVLAAQTHDVDVFTGATQSSVAFLNAVSDAMRVASGLPREPVAVIAPEGTVYVGFSPDGYIGGIHVAVTIADNGEIVFIEVTEHSETPGFANHAFPILIADVLAAQNPQVDIIVGATVTSVAFMEAVSNALIASGVELPAVITAPVDFEGTVFTGRSSAGFASEDGDVVVDVWLSDDGEIVFIEVTRHFETPSFADPAFRRLIADVLAAQSADVDIYTGATYTSNAFLEAVGRALEQAGN